MPRFIVTTKMRKNTNGVFIEPGMSVEIVTQSPSNPVITNGGTLVQERFLALYGVDLKRAGALNMMCLDVRQRNKKRRLCFSGVGRTRLPYALIFPLQGSSCLLALLISFAL